MRNGETKYTKNLLEPIVQSSSSYAEVMRSLGLTPSGGNHRNIKGYIQLYRLDTSHFNGQAWNRGQSRDSDFRVEAISQKLELTDDKFFVSGILHKSRSLRRRLLKIGRRYECSGEGCLLYKVENPQWAGKPLTLHIDHVNGSITDNRLENLRFLCPNCHQQTPTWGNKSGQV